jgi:hypothetical protein
MRRAVGCAWIAVALLASGAAWPFTAPFMGTGRTCYGGLFVRERAISWLIPFSQCQRVGFEVIEQWGEGDERNIVFQLKQKQPKCLFSIIYLRHQNQPDFGIMWDVTGYANMDDYLNSKKNAWRLSPTSQGCYLYVPSR